MTVPNKIIERASSVAMSSGNFMNGFGKEDLADQLYAAKMKLNKSIEDKKALGTQNKALKREI